MYINQATIYGNLTRDPELKALPSGMAVVAMAVATNRVRTGADGKRQEDVEYHNIVAFGKVAENCAKYLAKGNGVLVQGRIQTRSWEDDGIKHYKTEIISERVQFGLKRSATPAASADDIQITPEDIPF